MGVGKKTGKKSIGCETRWCKTTAETKHNDVKTTEILERAPKKWSHTPTQSCEEWPYEQARVKTKTEDKKKIQGLHLLSFSLSLSFSLHDVLFLSVLL